MERDDTNCGKRLRRPTAWAYVGLASMPGIYYIYCSTLHQCQLHYVYNLALLSQESISLLLSSAIYKECTLENQRADRLSDGDWQR